jgi:molecular chaperone HscB
VEAKTAVECWSCQAETHGERFCPSCGQLGPRAPGATHFDVFGLLPTYAVDPGELEQKYRELSFKLHPDRFAQAEAQVRRFSVEHTAALNEAWKVLKDPAGRAFYLLKLHGVDLETERGAEKVQMPLDFLEQVMSLREALEQARAKRDLDAVRTMADDVRREERGTLQEAVEALHRLEQDPNDERAKRLATQALGRVRYFTRFLEQVEAIEDEVLG